MTRTGLTIPRAVARLAVALLAASGLVAGAVGNGAPVQAAPALSLQVTSVAGPPQLAPGATGAYVVTVHNPNDTYDDGMQVLVTTGGSLRPTGAIAGAAGVACTAEPTTGTTTGGYRCFAASLQGGATTTLTASVQAAGAGQGRVEAVAWGLTDAPGSPQKSLTVAVSGPALPIVRREASGEAARTIQYLLRHHGADVVVDGDFGEQTEERVRAFQGTNGLDPDGVVGPRTWPKLFVTVRRNDQGDAVRAVQSQLASRGVDVAVDGDFGEQTEQRVRTFQQAKGLAADGVVSPLTWAALVAGN